MVGREVVTALGELGHEAVPASRRTGVDIVTGTGLAEAVSRAEAVIHTADTMRPWEYGKVTEGGTRRVAQAVGTAPNRPHLVYISIVGVDRVKYPYYRAKLAAEMAIRDQPIDATIVRATQFHSLAAALSRAHIGPIALGLKGLQIQPVDIRYAAQELARVATADRPQGFVRHPDLAGPDRFDGEAIADLVAEHEGRRVTRRVEAPAVGGVVRSFTQGLLPSADAQIGGERFTEWLASQPRRLPRR